MGLMILHSFLDFLGRFGCLAIYSREILNLSFEEFSIAHCCYQSGTNVRQKKMI